MKEFRSVKELGAHACIYKVRVEARTTAAIRVAWLAYWLVRPLGEQRALDAAWWFGWRLARYRIEGGPWRRFAFPEVVLATHHSFVSASCAGLCISSRKRIAHTST